MASEKKRKKHPGGRNQDDAASAIEAISTTRPINTTATPTPTTERWIELQKNQVPLRETPAGPFVTLKYRVPFQVGETEGKSKGKENVRDRDQADEEEEHGSDEEMKDLTHGAFHGTRSRSGDQTSNSHQLPPPTQAAPPPPPVKLRLNFAANGIPTTPPRRLEAAQDSAGAPSTLSLKRKSALKQYDAATTAAATASTSKAQKRVNFSTPVQFVVDSSSPAPPVERTPSSAIRTPSLKLSLKPPQVNTASSNTAGRTSKPPRKKQSKVTNGDTLGSGKKRKRQDVLDRSEDERAPGHKRPSPQRKLTLKTKPPIPQQPVRAPTLTLKAKGKIPKRPPGVGYDSELEERENDPVILDAFILRMVPGPDCDYIQKHISEGTVGLHRIQGGADIQFKLFDAHGRRGMMTVRKQPYAITMVDLPCIIEGMKTWDKKSFIKSVDISQMLLVLGPCKNEEEAKNYPLPPEVDPKTHQYAHGLTAPMHNVRKRRFNKTKRTNVDDIESIERRVEMLLKADEEAESVEWKVFDHDPREDESPVEEEYSESEEDQDEEDIDGEAEPDDYFQNQPEQHGEIVETPLYQESPALEEDDNIEEEFARELMSDEDEEDSVLQTNGALKPAATLHAPEGSSFAVTSTSASPSATGDAVGTPASVEQARSAEEEDEEGSGEDDDESDGEDVSDEDEDEQAKEKDAALQEAKDNIAEMERKVLVFEEQMKAATSPILRAKLRKQMQSLRDEIDNLRRKWGL